MIHFSLANIRSIADSSIFSLGYDINEASLCEVKNVSMIADDIMQILSTTQGKRKYKQTINIYAKDEGIKVLGKCSCELGKNCKHVIASALAYLDEEAEQEEVVVPISTKSEKERWLHAFQESFVVKGEEDFTTSTILLYSFHLDKSEKVVELSLYTARQLKGGGYGKVNRARPNTLFNTLRAPEYLRENDKEAVLFFKTLSQGTKTTIEIKGKLGALLIESALKTQRCYWQKGYKKALHLDEDRELELEWKEHADFAQLGFELGENTHLISTDPAYYIDTKEKTLGVIDTELSSVQLDLLCRSPRLQTDELEEFSWQMSEELPHLHIPAPKHIDVRTIEDASAVPCIHFSQSKGNYTLEMSFNYEGHKISAFPSIALHSLGAQRLKLKRDLELESRYIQMIHDYGFKGHKFTSVKIEAWKNLLADIELLRDKGFEISQDKSFKLNFENISTVDVKVEQTSHWFDVHMHITIDNQQLPLLPILSQLLKEGTDLGKEDEIYFEIEEDRYISIASTLLEPILKTFYELLDKPNSEGFKLQRFEAPVIENFKDKGFKLSGDAHLKNLAKEIKKPSKIKIESKGLKATLREYQQEGVAWMQFLRSYGFGGILADDMGLGKTIQTLSNLLIEQEEGRLDKPALIVAPTSLLGNWKAEAEKFTPSLKVALYYGNKRRDVLSDINKYDLIVTSYTILALDIETLKREHFHYLVLDEAQRIKNARSESAKAVKLIRANHALALSGTPMENHLGELHSIFDALMSGFLGSISEFKTLYQNPIEKQQDTKAQDRLNKRIKPFMLRRTKDKVAKELPPKTEVIHYVTFKPEQARLYETIRVSMEKRVRETIKAMGLGKSHISILDALLKLRQVCCDPKLLKFEEAQKIHESAKLDMLMGLVHELREEKRRILIFSQFTSMLDIIQEQMEAYMIPYSKLTGATRKRQDEIDKFTQGKTEIFLISLKAGGVGLNLTEADTVIHYDPWWNPAAQDQATDRAYRIGQDNPVFVYKLVVQNSVEEKIVQMQEDKKALAQAIYEGKEQGFSKMKENELLSLFE